MTKTIEIRDVGPVEHLSIPIPEGGGVVVLKGRNSKGKSHSLAAVSALLGGKGKVVSRDGSLGASVEGLGARWTVGRSSTRSGELEVLTLEGEDPSLLVSPPVKDPAAADAIRLKAIARLAGATAELSEFADLVGGMERLTELCRPASLDCRDGVPSQVAAIKRDLEAAARKEESASENAFATADGVRAVLKDFGDEFDFKCLSHVDARDAHTAAVRDQASIEAQHEHGQKLASAAREAQSGLEAMGDAGTGAADEAARSIEKNRDALSALGPDGYPGLLQSAQELVEAARCSVDRLRREFEAAERSLEAAVDEAAKQSMAGVTRTKLTADKVELKHRADAISQRASLQRAIAISASGATEVTPQALEDAAGKLALASSEVEAWVLHDKTRSMRAEVEEHDARGTAAANEGEALRRAAQGTEAVMMKAVRDVCGDDMEISDGRLYVTTDRGRELFSDLSPGPRWRMALEIAVKAVGHKGLLVICQEAYEGMDTANRMAVAAHAQSLGVVILTAEWDDGEIRAEVEPEVVRA